MVSYRDFEAIVSIENFDRELYDLLTTVNTFEKIAALFPDSCYRHVRNYFSLPADSEDNATIGKLSSHAENGFLSASDPDLDIDTTLASSPLCSNCAAMFQVENIWRDLTGTDAANRTLAWNGTQLQSAALSGCQLCLLNMRQLQYAYPECDLASIVSASYQLWRGDFGTNSIISLGRTKTGHGLKFTLNIEGSDQELALSYLLNPLPVSNPEPPGDDKSPQASTGSPESLKQISDWLKFCDRHHPVCRRHLESTSRRLPTRLLEISADGGSQLKLVTTADLPISTTYVTLSHCWGETSFKHSIKTRDSTYLQSIVTADLPCLFRDAIKVATSMRVHYVWIDSFCIKQNSHTDWVAESARMGDVYRFSVCNIAAARSVNSDQSMFVHREPLEVRPCIVEISGSGSVGKSPERWAVYQHDLLWTDNIGKAPLSQRAWVLQETVLAPRVVHFGRTQLFWECEMLRACETLPRGIPGVVTRKLGTGSFCLQFELQHADSSDLQWQQIWKCVIEAYSRRLLSETAKDKLTALSGLAKSLADPVQYFAGLWKPDLEYQLLWFCTDSSDSLRAPRSGSEYQAPTWSWASVNGPVHYVCRLQVNAPEAELLAEAHEISIDRLDADPTGQIGEDSHLTISAPLIRIQIGYQGLEDGYCDTINGVSGHVKWDCADPVQADQYYFLAVELKIKPGKSDKHKLLVGLVLCEAISVPGAFERVAYVSISNHINSDDFGDLLQSLRESDPMPPRLIVNRERETRTKAAEAYDFAVSCVKIV